MENLTDDDMLKLKEANALPRVINPFYYKDKINPYEIIKIIIGFALLPVRVILMILIVAIDFLAIVFVNSIENTNKAPTLLNKLVSPLTTFMSRMTLLVFGIWYLPVKGKKAKYKDAPVIIGAPHSNFLDPFIMYCLFGPFSGFGKASLKRVAFFRNASKFSRNIFVERSEKEGKAKALETYVERVNKALSGEKWPRFVTFPEGTCTNKKSLLHFKKGAFVPGAPCQVVLLRWKFCFHDPVWSAGGPNRLWMAFRMSTQFANYVQVEYLPEYHPSDAEKQDPDLYAANVQKLVSEHLKIPVSEHSYEDTFLARRARKLGFVDDIGKMFDFELIQLAGMGLSMPYKVYEDILKAFAAEKTSYSKVEGPTISYDQLVHSLRLVDPPTSITTIFDTLDDKSTKKLSFRKYFLAVLFLLSKFDAEKSASKITDFCFSSSKTKDKELFILDNENMAKIFDKGLPKMQNIIKKRNIVTKEQFIDALLKNRLSLLVAVHNMNRLDHSI